ncbi:MAG: hypothetical protein ACOH1T_07340 [Microbacteriaceae bacterium]
MKKTLATLALTVLLASTLSGCTLALKDPTPVAAESSTPQNPDEPTNGTDSPGLNASGACDDRDIVVDQDGAQIVLTGSCASVKITANDVAINIEEATTVTISGSGVNLIATDLGSVSVTGDNVTLNPDRVESLTMGGNFTTFVGSYVGALTITGNNNIANWDEGAASAKDSGTGNTVVAP